MAQTTRDHVLLRYYIQSAYRELEVTAPASLLLGSSVTIPLCVDIMAEPSRVKRSLDEDKFKNVSDMDASKSARVHETLASLSPTKNSTGGSKYFHTQLTHGIKQTRLVGFDAKVHAKLAEFNKTKEPIVVTNCQVKEAKYSSDFEVIVRNLPSSI